MRLQRALADFLIRTCGLRYLHGSRLQRGIRTLLDEIDLQHLRDTHPCESFSERLEFYRYINSTVAGDVPIDFLEFGVYRGESIREWIQLNEQAGSRFFGFDSFEGLPETWRQSQGKGHFDVGGEIPQIADPRVVFYKGWFDDTLPRFIRDFDAQNRIIVHLDADLYSSTLLPLTLLKPFLVADSLLIFDEFYDRDHEFKAFQDFLRISKLTYRVRCQMENYGKVCVQLL